MASPATVLQSLKGTQPSLHRWEGQRKRHTMARNNETVTATSPSRPTPPPPGPPTIDRKLPSREREGEKVVLGAWTVLILLHLSDPSGFRSIRGHPPPPPPPRPPSVSQAKAIAPRNWPLGTGAQDSLRGGEKGTRDLRQYPALPYIISVVVRAV